MNSQAQASNIIINLCNDLNMKPLAILKVGSNSWGCNNPHDTDYAVLVSNTEVTSTQRRYCQALNADIFIHGDIARDVNPLMLYAYIKAANEGNTLYGKLPYIKWKDVSKEVLRASYGKCLTELGKMISYPQTYPIVQKLCYYIWLNYYTEINKGFELSEEQRAVVQRIHDCEGTLQDLFDIKNKFEALFSAELDLI